MTETPTNPTPPPDATRKRRALFGLNTLVAVAAAVGLVVLLNWIAYRQFVRLDFTELGVYSLSPQTRAVLADLDARHEIVTLFSGSFARPGQRRVIDLIDEYDRASPRIDVTHLDIDRDVTRYDAFAARLRGRYESQLEPLVASIEAQRSAIHGFAQAAGPVVTELTAILADGGLPEGEARERLARALAALRSTVEQDARLRDDVDGALAEPLPDYPRQHAVLESTLSDLHTSLIPTLSQWFSQYGRDGAVPAAAQEGLLAAAEAIDAQRTPIREAVAAARDVEGVEAYQRARAELTGGGAVAVLAPGRARVIAERDMFIDVDPRLAEAAEDELGGVESRFLGEERLTGALVSLRMEQPPMVVFVDSQRAPALGPRGQFLHVADRLESLDVDVRRWTPGANMSQFGQFSPPQPAPEPAAGQRAVWVVLPQPPPDPRSPVRFEGGNAAQVAAQLRVRMAEGDGVMLFYTLQPGAMLSVPDALAELPGDWGVLPRLERLILREVAVGEDDARPDADFRVSRWPQGLPVTTALEGLLGRFNAVTPVVTEPVEGVETWPLVELGRRERRVWSVDASTLPPNTSPADLVYDESQSEGVYTPAVAAERGGVRMAVFTDAAWASDGVTTFGVIPGIGGGAGLAQLTGAAFPANAELFVNTTLWLAGLEDLIAASPRVQKSRRVADMDDGVRAAVVTALIAGVPAASLGLGVAVYLVRRRG